MISRRLRFPVVIISVLGVMGLLATASAHGQTMVVTAKSVSDLSEGLEHVIKAVAPADDPMAAMALNMLGQVKTGALLKGLDQSREFGLAVTLPKNPGAGEPPSVVAAV